MNQNCKNKRSNNSFPNFDCFNRQWDANAYISNLIIKPVEADGTRNTYHFHICVLTKVLAQPAPNFVLPDFDTTICDTSLEQVEPFPYLGSLLSNKCTSEKDVEPRIGAFEKLIKHAFNNKDINLVTKIMVYNIFIISIFLYCCETWNLYRHDI